VTRYQQFPCGSALRKIFTRSIIKDGRSDPSSLPAHHYCTVDRGLSRGVLSTLLRTCRCVRYQNLLKITPLKLDHFPIRDQRDHGGRMAASAPRRVASLWDDFNAGSLGPSWHRRCRSVAAPCEAAPRFGERSERPAGSGKPADRMGGVFPGAAHRPIHKLVSFLIYLPPDDSPKALGILSIARRKKSGFTCPDSNHDPFDEFRETLKTDPVPAKILASLTETLGPAVHGVEPQSAPGGVATCNREPNTVRPVDASARKRSRISPLGRNAGGAESEPIASVTGGWIVFVTPDAKGRVCAPSATSGAR